MGTFLKLDLSGITQIQEAIEKKNEDLINGVDDVITASVLDMNKEQKELAPVNTGLLRETLGFDVGTPLVKEVFSGVNYAPYVEFGTGGLVDVPAGLEDVAVQFKVQGLRKVNLPARPFFFPPYFDQKAKMIELLKKLLGR